MSEKKPDVFCDFALGPDRRIAMDTQEVGSIVIGPESDPNRGWFVAVHGKDGNELVHTGNIPSVDKVCRDVSTWLTFKPGQNPPDTSIFGGPIEDGLPIE